MLRAHKKDDKVIKGQKEDNTNDKSDDGDGLDKVQPKKQLRKSSKIEKTKTSTMMVMWIHLMNIFTKDVKQYLRQ